MIFKNMKITLNKKRESGIFILWPIIPIIIIIAIVIGTSSGPKISTDDLDNTNTSQTTNID